MTFVNPDTTFIQQADRVSAFYRQVADVRDKHGTGANDARRVNLNNVMMAANAATATLRLMAWAKQGGDGILVQALGLAKPEYINLVAEDLLRSSRLSLLTESQFQIEALFRNILLALGKALGKDGFYNVAKDVLAAAGVIDPAKLRILNVPALIRNSMHTNGIHQGWKGSNTIEIIRGVEFRFEHGKPVHCGSWYHIVTALSASLEVVDEILSAAPVKAVHVLPDAYAAQAAPGNPSAVKSSN
jgi:hypothetical protein